MAFMRLPVEQAAFRYGVSEGDIVSYSSGTCSSYSHIVVKTMEAAQRVSQSVKHIQITDKSEAASGLPTTFKLGQVTEKWEHNYNCPECKPLYWVTCV